MINLLQPATPEHGSFARGNLSKRPNLWGNDLVFCGKSSLGNSGMTLRDVSGHDNHGTFVNSPTWIKSDTGVALDFEASEDDNIILGVLNSEIFGSDCSVVMGLTPKSLPPVQILLDKRSGASSGMLFMSRSGDLSVQFSGGEISSGPILTAGVRSQIAFTRKGSDVQFYHNDDPFFSGFNGNDASNSHVAKLGTRSFTSDVNSMDCIFNYIYIYSRNLIHSEIIQINHDPDAMFQFADIGIWRAPVVGGGILKNPKYNFINNLITR